MTTLIRAPFLAIVLFACKEAPLDGDRRADPDADTTTVTAEVPGGDTPDDDTPVVTDTEDTEVGDTEDTEVGDTGVIDTGTPPADTASLDTGLVDTGLVVTPPTLPVGGLVDWDLSNEAPRCQSTTYVYPLPNEIGHWAMGMLTPPASPFTVETVRYSLVDIDGICDSSPEHRVRVWVESAGPDVFPVVLEEIVVPAGARAEGQLELELALSAPIVLGASESLAVAVEMYDGACLEMCLDDTTPGVNWWSSAVVAPYPWDELWPAFGLTGDYTIAASGTVDESLVETTCDDAADDDLDGLADCADPDCEVACLPAAVCGTNDLGSALGDTLASGNTNLFTASELGRSCGGAFSGIEEETWRWTAPADGTYRIDTWDGNDGDTVLFVLDECFGSELACNDQDIGNTSTVYVEAVAGQEFVIVVEPWLGDTTYSLNIHDVSCEGDELGSILGTNVAAVDTTSGSATVGAGCDETAYGELFHWTAPAAGFYELTTVGDHEHAVFVRASECLGAELDCSTSALGAGGDEASALVLLDAGEEVIIGVGSIAGSSGTVDLSIQEAFPTCVAPAADLGSALGAAVVMSNNAAGIALLGPSCSVPSSRQVAYHWTAPADGTYTFDTVGSPLDTVLMITDPCGLVELTCDDDTVGFQSSTSIDLVAGEQVMVFVGGWDAAVGNFVLNIN